MTTDRKLNHLVPANQSTELAPEIPAWHADSLLAWTALLMAVHYTLGECEFNPGLKVWKQWPFWSDFFRFTVLPLAFWIGWKTISFGKLKVSRILFQTAVLIVAGDVIFCALPQILGSLERLNFVRFKVPTSNWHWFSYWYGWTFWMPTIWLLGNLLILKRWWALVAAAFSLRALDTPQKPSNWPRKFLETFVIAITSTAVIVAIIRFEAPRLPVNDATTALAEMFLVPSNIKGDFEFLTSDPAYHGKRLGAILDHVKLANRQRRQFYSDLDEVMFRQYVLSPRVDDLPLDEIDWRRMLWKYFWPQVRNDHDPISAAKTTVRCLRELVGISPIYSSRVGVNTIWTEQMTDEAGFNRIYVAALRSVGIAARLSSESQAELWTIGEWRTAPSSPLHSFSEEQAIATPQRGRSLDP
jgi:hypothetical protein